MSAAPALVRQTAARPAHAWQVGLRSFLGHRMALAGAVIVLAVALLAAIGPFVTPWDYRVQDLEAVLANRNRPLPPLSPGHLLGTDSLGRDLLSRVMDGARVTMSVAVIVQLVVVAIGVPIGAVAGWLGGRVDGLLMRFTDVVHAFPDLLFIILVSASFVSTPIGRALDGLLVIFVSIGLVSWVTMARLVRAQLLSLKEREYVEAARAMGVPARRIVLRHLLPNAIGPIVVAVSLGIPTALLTESTLSFLGLGVQIPRASWGSLIAFGAEDMARYPHLVVPPVVAIVVTLIGFTLLGDGLRDLLDPRTRRR